MNPDRTNTVVIVDDQPVVRDGLTMLINSQADLSVIGQAGNGEEAVEVVRSTHPDVVLMDIRMPGMNGIEATREIIAHPADGASTKVVILTTYDLDEYVFDALNAGASGFLLKHAPPEQILLGVRSAADGGALISPTITIRLIQSFGPNGQRAVANPTEIGRLTPREREVFDLVVAGGNNAEIAADLLVGESTVKTHINRVLFKLHLRDRVHAVLYAHEHGLITSARDRTRRLTK